jgi:benzaldehyde dehydrogenase (NAD)
MNLLDDQIWQRRIFTGSWATSAGSVMVVREPATGAELGSVGLAGPDNIAAAAQRAASVQPNWASTSFEERAAVLHRVADLIAAHADECESWLVREGGAVRAKARFEIGLAVQECRAAAALPIGANGDLLADVPDRLSMAQRVPVGVVGVISPFNAPLVLALRSVAPALALGNTVVLKPDPRTAVCGGVVLARLFEEAGLPPGALHVLPGDAEAGAALVADPRVAVISFTGSTTAGRAVGELAARHLKRAHLELGGNAALVVLEDADVPAAVSAAAFGSFFHQGQTCMTTGRHLVHESLYAQYVDLLAEKAQRLPVGDPAREDVPIGPVIDAAQRDRIHSLVTASVSSGARLAAGGTYEGLFYRPTVLADVTPAAPAYQQEVFGPVAPVIRFSSVDEAVKLAADTEYGLSLGIITRDVMAGLELAARIPSGIVHINEQTVDDSAYVPFGGVRASGAGSRFGGPSANIHAFTETRWVTVRGNVPAYPF